MALAPILDASPELVDRFAAMLKRRQAELDRAYDHRSFSLLDQGGFADLIRGFFGSSLRDDAVASPDERPGGVLTSAAAAAPGLPQPEHRVGSEIRRMLPPALERVVSVVLEANFAGHAIGQAALPGGQPVRQVGLADEGPGEREEVRIAGAHELLHDGGRAHAADEDDRTGHPSLQRTGEVPIVGLGARRPPQAGPDPILEGAAGADRHIGPYVLEV